MMWHCYSGNLFGGIESALATMARAGVASRFALCFGGALREALEGAGAEVLDAGPARLSRPWTARRARGRLLEALLREGPGGSGGVVCHGYWALAVFGPAARRAGVPLVLAAHDVPGSGHWLEVWARRFGARPTLIAANSEATAAGMRRLFPGVSVDVAPPPLGEDWGEADAGAPGRAGILTAARLVALKGQHVLIEALGSADLRGDRRWVCRIAGGARTEGERRYLEGLRSRAEALGIADRVEFLGHRGDVGALARESSILAAPNTAGESFGLSALEGMRAGLAVVASRVPGPGDLIRDGETGLLVPPGDVGALARALGELIASPARRAELGRAARAEARARFDRESALGYWSELEGRLRRGRPWVLVAGDFAEGGGMDRANLALARHLTDVAGVRVHVVAHRASADLVGRPNARWHRIPRPFGKHRLGFRLLDLGGRLTVRRLRRAGEAPVVVANGGNCQVAADLNWFHYVHAANAASGAGGRRRWEAGECRRERAAGLSARIAVANSERTARDLIELAGIPPDRVRVARYGIDAGRFRPRSEGERLRIRERLAAEIEGAGASGPIALFVGALGDGRKGLATLWEAWREVSAGLPGARLWVAGAGRGLEGWRARAAREGAGTVRFLGYRADVDELTAAADALVSPALYEAHGLNVHEAIASGCPALASASSGVAELYPGDLRGDWLLEDPRDARELAAKLGRALSDPSGARRAFAEFSARLRERDWEACASEIAALGRGDRLEVSGSGSVSGAGAREGVEGVGSGGVLR